MGHNTFWQYPCPAASLARDLTISIGQHSDQGRKKTNQDFHGALIPEQPALGMKGIAIVLADGISSSAVSGIASESAVKGFLTDYYCTSEAWSVKRSVERVRKRSGHLCGSLVVRRDERLHRQGRKCPKRLLYHGART